jgi:hypothetical protein
MHFESIMTVAVALITFLFGIFFIVPPIIPADNTQPNGTDTNGTSNEEVGGAVNLTDAEMQTSIENFIDDFVVEITPWTPSSLGERVRVSVTNTSQANYNWAIVHIVFIDDNGNTIKTATGGTYSNIMPNDTVNIYMSADGLQNSMGFVYAVETDRFIYDSDMGLISQ